MPVSVIAALLLAGVASSALAEVRWEHRKWPPQVVYGLPMPQTYYVLQELVVVDGAETWVDVPVVDGP